MFSLIASEFLWSRRFDMLAPLVQPATPDWRGVAFPPSWLRRCWQTAATRRVVLFPLKTSLPTMYFLSSAAESNSGDMAAAISTLVRCCMSTPPTDGRGPWVAMPLKLPPAESVCLFDVRDVNG